MSTILKLRIKNTMKIEEIHTQEVKYILDNLVNIEYRELSDVKLIFLKGYSENLIEKVKRILNKKLFFLLFFFSNDTFEYFEKNEDKLCVIDSLSLYSFNLDKRKHILLFSRIYNKRNIGIKEEKVEIFGKK